MLKSKIHDDSDGTILYYCRTCGIEWPYNNTDDLDIKAIMLPCRNCGSLNICSMNTCHINNYLNSVIESCGININWEFEKTNIIVEEKQ